jgi:hypothetical protein
VARKRPGAAGRVNSLLQQHFLDSGGDLCGQPQKPPLPKNQSGAIFGQGPDHSAAGKR